MNQRINTDSKNSKEPQQTYRLGTVSIKIGGGGGLKPVLQAPNFKRIYKYPEEPDLRLFVEASYGSPYCTSER